jgi:hypothetical protein
MKMTRLAWLIVPIIAASTESCASANPGRPETPAVSAAPAATLATAAAPPAPDSAAILRAQFAKEVLASIAGHENEPAGQVFKNVKSLTTVPAGRLVAIMSLGYGRSLGVSCTHCHVAGDWASDDKPQKQIARDMIQMAATINTQLLANIKNLKGPQPIVNCTTCHRGQVKPALNLP